MKTSSYTIIRLAIALSFFGHGLVRMPKLNGFSEWMVKNFENSMIPSSLVQPFSYVVPIAELIIGLLLILGLYTKQSAIAGAVLMLALLFGTCMIENWGGLPTQFIHLAFLVAVIQYSEANKMSLDFYVRRTL
ncbi:DoxX family membrane protein [Membranihabitans marinus]|uniref:DoxX family membrane protein n=1 Tax=Membranihabitans marinus TaxID=1227546 RepID=UPI001F1A4631|nr:DoxX family membrane protein [Membranihabitans marinus]